MSFDLDMPARRCAGKGQSVQMNDHSIGGFEMVFAIILVKLTRDGKTNIEDAPKRVENDFCLIDSTIL